MGGAFLIQRRHQQMKIPCHICHREDDDHNLTVAAQLVRGIKEPIRVHQQCLDNHMRTALREAYLNDEYIRAKYPLFRDWLAANGC
jgi:hypothetical protein